MKRIVFALALCACSRTTNLVDERADAAPSTPDAAPIPVRDASAIIARCGDAPCACSNGIDDDGDMLTDGLDPECSAPFDDDENSFAVGVHGEDRTAKCQGCFFDGNSGLSECRRAQQCAIDGTTIGAPGACRSCDVPANCRDSCLPRVPNGCDCFGCCQVYRGGALVANVLLSDDCSLADLDDAAKCQRCMPAQDCRNPCGECELCTGRTALDLPAQCGDEGFVCEDAPACEGDRDCAAMRYCQLGCCLEAGI